MKINNQFLLCLAYLFLLSSSSMAQEASATEVVKGNVEMNSINDSLTQAAYFDFWVGEWKASWTEGEGKIGKGTNSITKIIGGKGIQEDFSIEEGQSAGFKGRSISMFTAKKIWKQTWMDSDGGYFDFTGGIENGQPVFKTEMVISGDQQVMQKMVFNDITEDAFTWDWLGTRDGGKTWNLLWQITYKRIQ